MAAVSLFGGVCVWSMGGCADVVLFGLCLSLLLRCVVLYCVEQMNVLVSLAGVGGVL